MYRKGLLLFLSNLYTRALITKQFTNEQQTTRWAKEVEKSKPRIVFIKNLFARTIINAISGCLFFIFVFNSQQELQVMAIFVFVF